MFRLPQYDIPFKAIQKVEKSVFFYSERSVAFVKNEYLILNCECHLYKSKLMNLFQSGIANFLGVVWFGSLSPN